VWNYTSTPQYVFMAWGLVKHRQLYLIFIYNKGDVTDRCNYRGMLPLTTKYNTLSNSLFSRLTPYIDQYVFRHIDQPFIRYSVFVRCWKKLEYNGTVPQSFIDFEKACDSVRKEVLYNILNEFDILTNLVRLIIMCLNETHSEFHTGKNLSD